MAKSKSQIFTVTNVLAALALSISLVSLWSSERNRISAVKYNEDIQRPYLNFVVFPDPENDRRAKLYIQNGGPTAAEVTGLRYYASEFDFNNKRRHPYLNEGFSGLPSIGFRIMPYSRHMIADITVLEDRPENAVALLQRFTLGICYTSVEYKRTWVVYRPPEQFKDVSEDTTIDNRCPFKS